MDNDIYSRVYTAIRKIGMQDRVKIIPCKYGYECIEVACENRLEREAVVDAVKIKGAMIETFFPGIHDSIGVVRVHDAARYSECRKKIAEDLARVEDWWKRYHEADDATKKLMACGKVE